MDKYIKFQGRLVQAQWGQVCSTGPRSLRAGGDKHWQLWVVFYGLGVKAGGNISARLEVEAGGFFALNYIVVAGPTPGR